MTKLAFPGMAAQFRSDWDDWSVSGVTMMYERAVLVDRSVSRDASRKRGGGEKRGLTVCDVLGLGSQAGNRGTACIGPRKRMMKMNR